MGKHLRKAHGVEHAIFWYASLASDGNTPLHQIEFTDGMCVRIDAEHAAELQRLAVPAPVEFQLCDAEARRQKRPRPAVVLLGQ